MSGIAGIVRSPGQTVERRRVADLTQALAFRGPDRQDVWAREHAALGHAWLQTEPGTTDRQPVSDADRVFVVADARLDGRADLRIALEQAGRAVSRDASDADLILAAYAVWDVDCVEHLIGDFAFAVWDRVRNRLLCVRDQVGVRPLFYVTDADGVTFASGLAALRRLPGVTSGLNDQAIADFLLFGHNPEHDTTAFARVKRLPPAHLLEWTPERGLSVRRYWTLPRREPLYLADRREYVERFDALLRSAVADRIRTGPVTISLSGGLDSALVAATAHDLLHGAGRGRDLRASTATFEHSITDPERPFASAVAASLGLPIDYHAVDKYPLLEWRPYRVFHSAEPMSLAGMAAHVERLQAVTSHSRVMLTGQGGDVLLRPSAEHLSDVLSTTGALATARWAWTHLRTYGRLPRLGVRTALRRATGRTLKGRSSFPDWLAPELEQRLDLQARWRDVRNRPLPMPAHHRPEAYAFATAPDWARRFEAYDAGRTGVALDIRHPLFDLRLVDFALTIPTLPWCPDKGLVRELLRGRIPDAVRLRAKTPLGRNPAEDRMARGDAHWLVDAPPSPLVHRYVRGFAAPSPGGTGSLTRLRPFYLNAWLRSLDGDLTVADPSMEEPVDALTAR